jgi:hypothetical protein
MNRLLVWIFQKQIYLIRINANTRTS